MKKYISIVLLVLCSISVSMIWEEDKPINSQAAPSDKEGKVKIMDPQNAANLADQIFDAGDFKQAFKYFKIAADQNHADAQFNLGLMYYLGQNIEENESEGIRYFKLAADQGDARALSM